MYLIEDNIYFDFSNLYILHWPGLTKAELIKYPQLLKLD